MEIKIVTPVQQDIQTVFAGFNEKLFLALAPPLLPIKLLRFDGSSTNDEVHLVVPPRQKWVSIITDHAITDKEIYFIDEGKELPFFLKTWQHQHRIVQGKSGGSQIIDHITYTSPNIVLDYLLYPTLYAQFAYRKPVYQRFFGKIN